MKRRIVAACVAVVGAAAVAMLGSGSPAHAADPPRGVDTLAQGGFGDARNSYSWSMSWFKGRLYVGTARQEGCFENLTIDYYLPVLEQYKNGKFPGVTCPKNPWDMDLRAEIWQYTPGAGKWRRVFRSPADIPNPAARGKTVARDIGFRGMAVYHDARGRPALYVAGVTADEVLPSLKRTHPPRLLMTTDGRHFKPVSTRGAIMRNPFGTTRVIGARSLQVFHGKLYVTLTGGLTGDGEIYEITRPWGPKAHFKQITPRTMAVFEMQAFHGALYAGTGDRTTGYGVYKTTDTHAPYRWTPVVTNAAGRGSRITSVVSMHPYRGRLYVGSSGWYNDQIPQSELIRIAPSGSWDVVVGNARDVDGVTKAPISGLGDGFNSIFAAHFWRMVDQNGALYLGTNDWSWMLQLDQQWFPILKPVLSWEFGFDVWGSCDGQYWFPVTRNAFNANMDNFGARGMAASPRGLFVGSANHAQGTAVWLDRQLPCPRGGSSTRRGLRLLTAAPAAPQRVVADAQRNGTVVSWRATRTAARYRVLRAEQTQLSFSVRTPPARPDGFHGEDDVPMPVAPGTPGSTPFTGATLGPFRAIGSTSADVFVDRTRRPGASYAYQVVAEGPTGTASPPSSVQVIPDPRPAVTWSDLERAAVGTPGAGAVVRAAAASLRHGDRRATLARLWRVRRTAAVGSTLEDLAVRLARHIRYHDLAGGPA